MIMRHTEPRHAHPFTDFIPSDPITHIPPLSFLHHPYHSAGYALPDLPDSVVRALGPGYVSGSELLNDARERGEVRASRSNAERGKDRLIAVINPSTLLNPPTFTSTRRSRHHPYPYDQPMDAPTITPARGQKLFYTEVVRQISMQVEALERYALDIEKGFGRSSNGTGKGKGKERAAHQPDEIVDKEGSKPISKLDTFVRTLAGLQARHKQARTLLLASSRLAHGADADDGSHGNEHMMRNGDLGSVAEGESEEEDEGDDESPDMLLIIQDVHALPALLGPTNWRSILSLPTISTTFPSFPSAYPVAPISGSSSARANPHHDPEPATLKIGVLMTSPRSWSDDLALGMLAAHGAGGVVVDVPVMFFLEAVGREEILAALLPHPSQPTHPLLPHFLHHLLASSLSLIPYDVIPTLKRMARPLWRVYTGCLAEHAEGWMSEWGIGEESGRVKESGRHIEGGEDPVELALGMDVDQEYPVGDDAGLTERQRRLKHASGQDFIPFLRVTNALLLELNSRNKHAFQAANDHLLPGLISEERFLDVFLPNRDGRGATDGIGKVDRAEREIERLGLRGEEKDGARAFFQMMPSNDSGGDSNAASIAAEGFAMTNGSTRKRSIVTHHLDYLIPLRPSNPFSTPGSLMQNGKPQIPKPSIPKLPLFARYLLLAAYCASYNSPRSDLRIFGRGPIGSLKRKVDHTGQVSYEAMAAGGSKKKGGGTRKVRLGRTGKVPQSLLGPKAFGLDRMLAIFMALLVEHGWEEAMALRKDDGASDSEDDDVHTLQNGKGSLVFDEEEAVLTANKRDKMLRKEERRRRDWEDEVEEISRSVGLFGLIPEMERMRLLKRVTPRDRLDNIQIRCEAPKEMVDEYARTLKVDLSAYLVDGE